jgi:signal transduction histidine kinase
MDTERIDPIRALVWIEGAAVTLAVALDILLVAANHAFYAANHRWYFINLACIAVMAAVVFSIPHAPNRRFAAIALATATLIAIGWLPPDGFSLYVFAAILGARLTFAFGMYGALFAWSAFLVSMLARLGSGTSGPDSVAGPTPHDPILWILLVAPLSVLLALIFGMIALMNVYAVRSARAAASNERSRIALDLHDFLGHGLTTLRIQLQNAERYRDTDPEKANEYVTRAAASSAELLADVRETVALLHESPEKSPAFSVLFERLCSDFSIDHAVDIDVESHLEREPSGRVAVALYRTMQEALTNVVRHAQAQHVRATVSSNREQIVARVEDDGCGIADTAPRGHGLLSMRERVASVGGALSIESRPGGGTAVTATIPMEAAR